MNFEIDGKNTISVGSNEVLTIFKDYGPTIFADLRIRPSSETAEWIIERSTTINNNDMWVEWVKIPGQLDFEFNDGVG